MDYFLRAKDEQALYAALEAAGLVDAERNPVGVSLDIIGPISKRIGGTDEAPIMQQIEGFHANLRGELTADHVAVLPTIAAPNQPVRVWF